LRGGGGISGGGRRRGRRGRRRSEEVGHAAENMRYVILDAVAIGGGKRWRSGLANGAVAELRRFRVRVVGLEEPRHFFF